MSISTLLRLAEHKALSRVQLSGRVLDLGGDTHAEYRAYLKGQHAITSVNMDPATSPDITHDLETPLPITSGAYDHVLLINVLEHVYEYRQLLAEAYRVVRPGGTVTVVVPFLFPIHPDPHDFWRFSGETLRRECERLGFSDIQIESLGSGVLAAQYVMFDRLLPSFMRFLNYHTFGRLVPVFDRALVIVAQVLNKKYLPGDYALGYCVTARR